MKNILINASGAILGGVIGYFAFGWIKQQGLYAMILPGGLLGLGGSIAKNRSITFAIICGVAALGLSLFTEWSYFPRKETLDTFLLQLHRREPISLVMISIGAFLGFWVPYSRIQRERIADPAPRKNAAKDNSDDESDE